MNGSSIYFKNNNKQFTVDNFKILKQWNEFKNFVPVIYLEGIYNNLELNFSLI